MKHIYFCRNFLNKKNTQTLPTCDLLKISFSKLTIDGPNIFSSVKYNIVFFSKGFGQQVITEASEPFTTLPNSVTSAQMIWNCEFVIYLSPVG